MIIVYKYIMKTIKLINSELQYLDTILKCSITNTLCKLKKRILKANKLTIRKFTVDLDFSSERAMTNQRMSGELLCYTSSISSVAHPLITLRGNGQYDYLPRKP